ncbi:eukaryotic translation initiation factor 4 gamma 1-like isoform X2 [Gymnodraco acuticeps]|uniref:Eukaryotic translation initiation factor 4 gamma 1-like isoform X2 n=1 Tax=Gymnodraco acuticeps TaxID=8218 RepID=A0A6P8UPZ9_GYMAC|nr:eukaryotic translation initiation factor 4 gamma 1-like isoform X2 [Gymnodraco acuticeps]
MAQKAVQLDREVLSCCSNICSRHDEVMKIFCRTDQQCICYLCSVDEHKGHDTVSAAAERTERQRELEGSRENIQQRIQDGDKEVKLLQQEVEAVNGSADKAVEDSEKTFTELIRLMEKRSSDVKQQLRSQQKREVSRVRELQEKLEQEMAELKRRDAELQLLSHTEDHNQFLLSYPSLPALSEATHSSSINIRPLSYFEDVTAALSAVRDKLQDVLREEWTHVSPTEVEVLLSAAEPATRAGFLTHSQEITLDPNTAHTHLPRMEQYFNQMEKIIKDKKTSFKIRFMLQDVLDLQQPPGMGMGVGGPRRSAQMQSLSDDIQLNKAEKACKPSTKKTRVEVESESDDSEHGKTQELFKSVRSILNKLTPQKFQQLMKMVNNLTIDTEERLKGVIDLTFEKAIAEPNFSVVYGNMCRCLMGLKVETTDKPGFTVNFRKLLLNRCQKEFEKDQVDDEIFERKQKELDTATVPEEKQRLTEQLQCEKDNAHRRSMGNMKFIGELFKLKMLTEVIMHNNIVKLLKNHDEESLECLCRLLSTIGKDLDFEKAKPRMDQYFNQMEKIIKDKKTSFKIRFMLQDVLDLRRSSWVSRRGEQGSKTMEQIHTDAELEEQLEQIKVQHAFISKPSGGHGGRNDGGRNDGGGRGGRGNQGRGQTPQDEGWNTVPISTKSRPIDATRFSKITKCQWPIPQDGGWNTVPICKNQPVLSPGGKGSWGSWGSWGKGSSGLSTTAEPAEADPVCRVPSMTDDRGSREGARSKEDVTREKTDTPPPHPASTKPTLRKLTDKSTAIIEEYLHLNDMKEALQCVHEISSTQLLFLIVQIGLESTLERSTIARERMGLLLQQLIKAGTLPKQQYYNGLQEILEVAEDMAIDIPHIWLYLAELISPMLHEGGIPMGELFREISKPLIPLGQAGVLLVQILNLLCKEMSHKKAGAMWREGGLRWRDFLPEDVDVNKFVTEKKVEFTLGVESENGQKEELSSEELSKQIQRLIQDQADDQRLFDWIEANLDEQQMSSNMLVRALMTCICQSAIIYENPNKVDAAKIKKRAKVLQKYLSDDKKELQALYALQALMVELEQPANLLRMFFDSLYDEDVIKQEAFYKWESSKDPVEQQGKGLALKSVTAFFTWLREAEDEDESDNS